MKMTRLEAIKAWGRASREGKPIPDDVRKVLISTQNDSRHDFGVETPTARVRKEQVKRNMNGKKPLATSGAIRSAGGAFTPEQMEIYNQKRKLDNQKRKNNPQLYSKLIQDFIASGLSKKQATKKAKEIILSSTLDKLNIDKKPPSFRTKRIVKSNTLLNEKKIKSDPWHIAKVKQDKINLSKVEQRRIDTTLLRRPISCIECKIDFKSFGGFVDHTKDVHHASVSTPKLIVKNEAPIDSVDIVVGLPVLPANEPGEPVVSIPVAKTPEAFSDKWIRLFAEKGYSAAMVEAFKRDAIRENMTALQIHDFLSVCKPYKVPVKTLVRPLETIITPEYASTITEAVETLVEVPEASVANDSSYVVTLADSIEQALFADRIVRTRTNQNDFKERVATNFGYRCAITNSGEALEAAHIEPVGTGNNNTSNGVLMLACLHRLFDAGLMAIKPDALTVHFKANCTYFAKSTLEGKKINNHSVSLNKSGLLERWLSFNA
ncbi:TPA: HNH endonuclease [Escherichia coli]|uniref:HNH endonuclease signature motif containing protein n=1 Tax=Escherichia coli TaxID=562 RepID=UPI000BE31C7D|nr:HNH endonuclease signature motif containing protein [Escherichia coli]EFF3597330.1 HNH endonuclease [Escherichia coli]MBB7852890.1 HNH endonuclease [Escherichia coli]HAM4315518.1 HNH endonuclease [Escherichia coli]HAW3064022.1 HNH endonuclease [Escherichia coli]